MNKSVILAIGILSMALASCKKNHVCTCEEKSTTPAHELDGESIPETTSTTFKQHNTVDTKANAESWCESKNKVELLDPPEVIALGIPQTTVKTNCSILND